MAFERNNFRTLSSSLLLLFRTMSGEDWQLLMEGSYITDQTLCNSTDIGGSTCGSPVNTVYFISFVLITFLLLLNVMMAVIMDNFETIHIDASELQLHHIDEFIHEWRRLDPTGKGRIKRLQLVSLLKSISPPLGLGTWCPQLFVHQFLAKLPVPLLENDEVPFRATLVGLIRAQLGLWLFDFKKVEEIENLLGYIAPNVPAKHIEEAVMHTEERIDLRFFYTVVRLQTLQRQKKDKKYRPSVDIGMPPVHLHANVKKLQQRRESAAQKRASKHVKKAKKEEKREEPTSPGASAFSRASFSVGNPSETANPAYVDKDDEDSEDPTIMFPAGVRLPRISDASVDATAALTKANVDGNMSSGNAEIDADATIASTASSEEEFGFPE